MTNPYFNNTRTHLPGSRARGDAVDDDFDAVGAGFDAADLAIKRAIKLPVSETSDQVISESAINRANKVIGFSSSGDVELKPAVWSGEPLIVAGDANKIVTVKADETGYELRDTIYLGGALVTASAAEVNILDGVTASTAELNYLDITAAGTAQASKAVVLDANKAISSLGHVGIGTTVSSWQSGYYALQASSGSFAFGGTTLFVGANAYIDTGYKYKGTGYVNGIDFDLGSNGIVEFFTAASGTAGNAVTKETQLKILRTASAVNHLRITGAASAGKPEISVFGTDSNIGLKISSYGTGTIDFYVNGAIQFAIDQATTAVNYLYAAGSATGNAVSLSAAGTDSNINIDLNAKAAGIIRARSTTLANYLTLNPAATTSSPTLAASGSDTNIHLTLSGKGTGGLITPQHIGIGAAPADWLSSLYTLDASYAAFIGGTDRAAMAYNLYRDGTSWKYKANGYGFYVEQSDSGFIVYSAPNNVSGAGATATVTERMTVDVSGNLSIDGRISSTRAAETGYTRLTPNYCIRDSTPSFTSISSWGADVTVGAPSTNAYAVDLILYAEAVSNNGAGDRYTFLDAYSSSGAANYQFGAAAQGYEFSAVVGRTIASDYIRGKVRLTSIGANFYLRGSRDNTNNLASYAICGYWD